MGVAKARCIGGNLSAGCRSNTTARLPENHSEPRWGYMLFHSPVHVNSLHSSRDLGWTIERGIDRPPEMDTSPYPSDRIDHFRIAKTERSIFPDTARHVRMCACLRSILRSSLPNATALSTGCDVRILWSDKVRQIPY